MKVSLDKTTREAETIRRELQDHKREMDPAVAFYHNNNTGRWLSTFKVIFGLLS